MNRCRSRSFEEIVGISDELLPDFAGMIVGQSACQTSGFDRSSETQEMVQRNLRPFHDLIAHAGLIPLLTEIAVIHDPRIATSHRQVETWREMDPVISTFFVSDIASYSSKSPGTLLRAWDSAIERLLEPGVNGVPRAVVPNSLTYTQAAYSISLRPLFDDAEHSINAIGRHDFLVSNWPETGEAPRVTRPARSLVSRSSQLPVDDAASPAIRKRYQFAWADDEQDVCSSIDALARGLVYYVLARCPESDDAGADERCGALRDVLTRSHLLIVPFRRPQMMGTESSVTERQGRDRSTFGGCLFALVGEQGVPSTMNDLDVLSVRLSWLLVRSALAEAYSGIALKRDKDYLLAVATHHLPSELHTLETHIGDVSDYLIRPAIAGPHPKKILDKADKAITLAQRLGRTAQMIRDGEKSVRLGRPERTFSTHRDLATFDDELRSIVNESWQQAFAPLHDKPEYVGVELAYDGAACGSVSDSLIHAVWTDVDYLRYVIAELMRNALIHGRFHSHKRVTVACRLSNGANVSKGAHGFNGDSDPIVSLVVLNPISSEQMPKVRAFLDGGGGRIGVSTLERCALAFGVEIPNYDLVDGDGFVEALVVIARGVQASLKAVGASQ